MGRPAGPRPGVAASARQASASWSPAKVKRSGLVVTDRDTEGRGSGPMPRSEYARRGLIKQQPMLPGMESVNPPPKLGKWEDMPAERRAETERKLSGGYGVTMRNAIHNHGALIDRSITTTGEAGRHFYRGGSDDPQSQAGHAGVKQVAQQGGISFPRAAYLRASLSPRSNVHDEIKNAHVMTGWFNDRRDEDVPKIGGLSGKYNAAKGAAVLRHEGEPHEARNEKGERQFGTPTTKKISSYAQSYTHPDHPDTRTAVDTHAVGGMAPHLPKSAPLKPSGKLDKKGKPFLKPVAKGHEEWVPNQEDVLDVGGAYEFFDHAQRRAAEKRGLSGTEGQSLAWHAERSTRPTGQQPGTGRGKASKNRPEEKPHVHPGQQSLL